MQARRLHYESDSNSVRNDFNPRWIVHVSSPTDNMRQPRSTQRLAYGAVRGKIAQWIRAPDPTDTSDEPGGSTS